MIKKPLTLNIAPRSALACARWTLIGLTAIGAVGCSVLEEGKVDYRSAKKVSNLEVPPDLTQLSRDSRYLVPGASVTASSMQQQAQAQPAAAVVTADSKLRIERAGSQRWLVIDRAPEKLWEPLREFWQESGFNLALEQEKLGIMETEWNENRAKIPQDFIRQTIGKVFDNLYSSGERDKFRTRIERNAQGGSEIYISHRGMQEVYTSDKKESTAWQPRPSDPELEAEFLRRLMLKLGTSPEQAKAVLTTSTQPQAARTANVNGVPTLQLAESFDRAWRRVGLALDRTGFTVEDRDRTQGIYFVRYLPSDNATKDGKPGFLSGLFGAKAQEITPQRYRIKVGSDVTQSQVSVLDAQGKPDTSPTAGKILQLLANDLK
ncbi:MAG: outer membrane protein assembly factor BamC [Burkholderiales bacterium]|nr:outer membrane protein assembly factor BamC [Burkholderiales bacterium]